MALLVALLLQSPSNAVGLVITGVVTDKLGSNLVGASVTDGAQTVLTDADGRYTLVETNPAKYTITSSKIGYVSDSKRVDTLNNVADVNFSLLFEISAAVSPKYFNAVPQDLTASASSLAPSNTVLVANFPGGFILTLVHQGISEGTNNWLAIRNIGTGSSDGAYNVSFQGKVSGTAVTPLRTLTYFLDRAPPVLSSAAASPNGSNALATRSASPLISMTALDPLSGVDPTSVTASVQDSQGNVLSAGGGSYASNKVSYQVPASAALVDGSYTATFGVNDRAGNSASSTSSFLVDTSAPFVGYPVPNDDVGTSTPRISVKVTDTGPSSLTSPSIMLDGVTVATSYDAGTNEAFHVVPAVPSLFAGEHQVVASAEDSAGNSSSLQFKFWVLQRLGYDALVRRYSPTNCSASGVSLLSLLNGQAVSGQQVQHGLPQTHGTEGFSRYLFATSLDFLWSPALTGGPYEHEITGDGIPMNTSRPGSVGSGYECGAPADVHSRELLARSETTYARGEFGPSGAVADGSSLNAGTYAWRVKANTQLQSTSADRFVVASVTGRWPGSQTYYIDDAFSSSWQQTVRDAGALWSTASFGFTFAGTCGSFSPVDCGPQVNFVAKEGLGRNAPLGYTRYWVLPGIGGTPDRLECCFKVVINDLSPMFPGPGVPSYGEFDLFAVAGHELGHAAGLGHDFNYPASIMNNYLGAGWRRQSLMDFDKATLGYLYP
ncbi:MAG: Ig-like domain-containing protein [Actinomycetota bacterium]